MLENGNGGEVLLVRAEPLELAEKISHKMVDVVRLDDGALLLDVEPAWAGAINTVLVKKGVRVIELRKETTASQSPCVGSVILGHWRGRRGDLKW